MLSKSKGSARACRKEGDIGIFGFGNFLDRFFGFVPKDFFGFGVRFGLRIFQHPVFGFRRNNSGFSVLLSNVVFGFFYFESK